MVNSDISVLVLSRLPGRTGNSDYTGNVIRARGSYSYHARSLYVEFAARTIAAGAVVGIV